MSFLYYFLLGVVATGTRAYDSKSDSNDCDVVGTKRFLSIFNEKHSIWEQRCLCNPGYFGERCERIFSCVSGRPMNISCLEPMSAKFALLAIERCAPGQKLLEVCSCIPPYHGYRCEQFGVASFGQTVEQKIEYSENDQPERFLPPRQYRFKPVDRSWTVQSEYQPIRTSFWIRMFIGCCLLVACLAIGATCCMFCSIRRANKLRRQHREARLALLEGEQKSSRGALAPPSYEESENVFNECLAFSDSTTNGPAEMVYPNQATPTSEMTSSAENEATPIEPIILSSSVRPPFVHV